MKTIIMLLFGLAILAFFTFGCASMSSTAEANLKPTKEQIAQAHYPPEPKDYKEQVIRYFKYTLKDADSTRYDNWALHHAYLEGNPIIFSWAITVSVNAKNGFGGYTGYQEYFLWLNNGEIEDIFSVPRSHHIELLDIVEISNSSGTVRPKPTIASQ